MTPEPHTKEILIVQPGVEIVISLKGNYADVELEYIRLEALALKECARREEVRMRRLFEKAASNKGC